MATGSKNNFCHFQSSLRLCDAEKYLSYLFLFLVISWTFYNMVFHKPVLFVLGQKKWAGWLIQKSDLVRTSSAKIKSCLNGTEC